MKSERQIDRILMTLSLDTPKSSREIGETLNIPTNLVTPYIKRLLKQNQITCIEPPNHSRRNPKKYLLKKSCWMKRHKTVGKAWTVIQPETLKEWLESAKICEA